MARAFKLTPAQWAEIERRLLAGEARRRVAADYGVTEGAIRHKLSTRVSEMKAIANQIVDTEQRLAVLPMATQIATRTLADRLRSISVNLAAAAEYGAMTAHRLQALANSEVQKVDDAEPLASMDVLRNVKVLGELANDASKTGLSLLAANKDMARDQEEDDTEVHFHFGEHPPPDSK